MLVAVLGASPKPDRYSYRAMRQLAAYGHHPIGINPGRPRIDEFEVLGALDELPPGIHTLTVYVARERSQQACLALLGYGFSRVIFNPGSENEALAQQLRDSGVEVIEACTLVMLATGQF